MLPLRQRALTAARRSRPTGLRTSRSYASDSHGHGDHGHHAPAVEEGIGAAFYIAVGAIPVSMIAYSMAQPGKDGEPSSLTNAINSLSNFGKDWETRNHVRTVAMEQAAHDKHLLLYAGRNPHIEMKYPEAIQAGSPFNVPAGHYANMDKVVAHYRQQHLDEEDRKAQLAQKKAEAASKDYTQSGSNLPVPLGPGESTTRHDDGDIAVIVNIGMDRNRVTGNPSSGRPGPPRPGPSHQWEDGSDASDTLVSSVDASIEGPRPITTTTRSRLTIIEVPDDGDNSRLPQMPDCEFRQLDPDTIDRLMVPSPPTTLSRGLLTIEARERREREQELQARLFPGQRQEPPARQPSPADISTTISDESAVSPRSSPPPRSPRSPSLPDLPLRSSPGPVVSIKLINQDIGFGVFALTSFRKGDAIYEEDVALEATHDTHVIGRRDVAEEIKRLFRHDQPRLRTLFAAFPYLANIWLPTSSNDLSLDLIRLPSLVRGKGRVVCLIDPGEWQARFDAGAARVQRERHYMPFVRRTFHTDMLTTDWFGQYAFRLSPAEVSDAPHGAHHRAALYAVTCLINHHCAQFNCRVVAEPGRVRVLAHRDIAAGEELRINYQKDGRVRAGEFKCDCCEAAPGRLRRAVSKARAKTRVDKCSLI